MTEEQRKNRREAYKRWYYRHKDSDPNFREKVWGKKRKIARYSRNVFKAYGLTLEEVKRMYISQGGVCAICGYKFTPSSSKKDFNVDHDHESGRVRQLLCTTCNRAIGLLGDDISILSKAIDYLNKWSKQ